MNPTYFCGDDCGFIISIIVPKETISSPLAVTTNPSTAKEEMTAISVSISLCFKLPSAYIHLNIAGLLSPPPFSQADSLNIPLSLHTGLSSSFEEDHVSLGLLFFEKRLSCMAQICSSVFQPVLRHLLCVGIFILGSTKCNINIF